MGMHLSGNMFDGMLLRDCVNHRATNGPENPVVGTLNFVIKNLLLGDRGKPHDPNAPEVDKAPPEPVMDRIRRARVEMAHYRKLMLSRYTLYAATRIAGNSELPVRYVDLLHTFTGSAAAAGRFTLRLQKIRAEAIDNLAGHPTHQPREFKASLEDWWHSDLLRPDYAAKQLAETLELAGISKVS